MLFTTRYVRYIDIELNYLDMKFIYFAVWLAQNSQSDCRKEQNNIHDLWAVNGSQASDAFNPSESKSLWYA